MDRFSNDRVLADIQVLTALVDKKGFRDQVLRVLSHAAKISNFTVFTLVGKKGGFPKYSFGAGILGDYQLNQNARQLEKSVIFPDYISGHIDPDQSIGRHRPKKDTETEIWSIFQNANVLEKIFTTHYQGDIAYYISYYRDIDDGEISDVEMERLAMIVPIVDNLLILRHKVVGNSDHSLTIRQGIVKTLNRRKIAPFDRITPRETDVCDCIARGLTTDGMALELGVSVSSVKTLRHRAYRKMEIGSKNELFAMLLNFQV